jgi:glyoxylase-like metal-dependent hydrolase (beta-lactamase superfamily II)
MLQEESGCEIFIHGWELENVLARTDYGLYSVLLAACGVPGKTIEHFQQAYLGLERFCGQVKQARRLQEGDFLDFDRCGLRVIHTPGHTPGSICLLDPAKRTLIAGDTVLDKISPNPLLNPDPRKGAGYQVPGAGYRVSGAGYRVPGAGYQVPGAGYQVPGISTVPHEGKDIIRRTPDSKAEANSDARDLKPDTQHPTPGTRHPTPDTGHLTPERRNPRRFPALAAYLDSLKRLAEMAPTICWTSHGEPVHDLSSYRRDMETFIAARQNKILSLLRTAEWTPWRLSQQVFPDTRDVHTFLALSEITSHLDYALSLERAALEIRDGVEYWRAEK